MFKIIKHFNSHSYPQYLFKTWKQVAIIYEQDINTLRQQYSYWLVADHPEYGVIGAISLRPASVTNTTSPIIQELAPAIQKGWVGHYLYFHLEDEFMDAMDDQTFRVFMHTFYYELYQAVKTVCSMNQVPYVCVFSNPDQYTGATLMGSLPFKDVIPIRTWSHDTIIAFLPLNICLHKKL